MAVKKLATIQNFLGLSTDTKPTTDVAVGSYFYETDTKDTYVYDGSNWNAYGRDSSSSSTPTGSVVTITTASTLIVSANADRKSILIQNQSTQAVICRVGGTVSTSAYNFVLNACTGARDGLGGAFSDSDERGAIYGICETGTSVISVYEKE